MLIPVYCNADEGRVEVFKAPTWWIVE